MDKLKSRPRTAPAASPPHAATAGVVNSRSRMNIQSLLLKCAVASTPPGKSLAHPQRAFIERRVQQLLPSLHTPDHPPYASMIESAIEELKEEGGSSENSISKFILQEYQDLPLAHPALLKHHLKQLSQSDDLVQNPIGCYSICKSSTFISPSLSPGNSCSSGTSPSSSPSSSSSSDSSYYSSPVNESSSSSTYGSSDGYSLETEEWVPMKRRRMIRNKPRKSRNDTQILNKRSSGQARRHGRGCGSGLDLNKLENEPSVDIQPPECVILIENGPLDRENRVDGEMIDRTKCSTASVIPFTQRKRWISEAGKKRDGEATVEEDEEDMVDLDKLVENVYLEVKGETENARPHTGKSRSRKRRGKSVG